MEGIPARRALEIAVRDGSITVNTQRRWGEDRMTRACRRAVKKGWLKAAGGKPDRFQFVPTDAGRLALSPTPQEADHAD